MTIKCLGIFATGHLFVGVSNPITLMTRHVMKCVYHSFINVAVVADVVVCSLYRNLHSNLMHEHALWCFVICLGGKHLEWSAFCKKRFCATLFDGQMKSKLVAT